MQIQGEKEVKEWTIYVEGSSNKKKNGARLILMGPNWQRNEYALCLQFSIINNIVEDKALILSLELVKEVGA